MPISEEALNALVDGELPPEREAEMLARAAGDPAIHHALCELRTIKHLTQAAYRDVPQAAPRGRARRPRVGGWAVAAGLAVAVLVGWSLAGGGPRPAAISGERFALLSPEGRGARPAAAVDGETRIVFHLLTAAAPNAGDLLDEVEALLADFRDRGASLRVEVVAHSEGLALLRERLSRHKARVARLAREYPNLAFVACRNTIHRLRVEQGVEVVLLPEAEVTESGVAHVVRRQQEGWAYIKV